jgi:hypothetical protein
MMISNFKWNHFCGDAYRKNEHHHGTPCHTETYISLKGTDFGTVMLVTLVYVFIYEFIFILYTFCLL